MKIMQENRISPDGMPRFAVLYLGLFCLPVSHKRDARLIWVNLFHLNIPLLPYSIKHRLIASAEIK